MPYSLGIMAAKTRRLEARIDQSTEERLRRAASLARQTTSAFVVEAALERADWVLARADRVLMPDADFDRLLEALDRPPAPAPELLRHARSWAFARE
jgi:uncharacterized protein (DUF1778 family)